MADECPVCLERFGARRSPVAMEACRHAVCEACFARLLQRRGPLRCVLCRRAIVGVAPSQLGTVAARECLMRVERGRHVGVTLTDCAAGVRVVTTHRRDLARRHLRRNDVLLGVNGIPCRDHAAMSDLFSNLTVAGRDARMLLA